MIGAGRTIGIILVIIGIGICGLISVFIGSGITSNQVGTPGAILGIGLFGVIPLLLLGGVGAYLFVKGGAEATEMLEVRKKERLLGMIQAQGQVSVGSAAVELKMTRDQIKTAIYELVNMGLFSGYIDWNKQMFYSQDAAKIGSNKCPNCGGIREFVGKGIVKCPYCGVDLFVPPDAPQTTAVPQPPTDNVTSVSPSLGSKSQTPEISYPQSLGSPERSGGDEAKGTEGRGQSEGEEAEQKDA